MASFTFMTPYPERCPDNAFDFFQRSSFRLHLAEPSENVSESLFLAVSKRCFYRCSRFCRSARRDVKTAIFRERLHYQLMNDGTSFSFSFQVYDDLFHGFIVNLYNKKRLLPDCRPPTLHIQGSAQLWQIRVKHTEDWTGLPPLYQEPPKICLPVLLFRGYFSLISGRRLAA